MADVIGIGACNVDIYCRSLIEFKDHYDHPSKIHIATGGVTRNILEALSKLNISTSLLTVLGDDIFKEEIINNCHKNNINIDHVKIIKGINSGLFVEILDKDGELKEAMCDMSSLEYLNIDYIKENDELIRNSKAITIDPSLKEEVIEYILDTYKDIPVFIDPVSEEYALKLRKYINRFYACKPNIKEAEMLADMPIHTDTDLDIASDKLIKAGLKEIYITMNKDGCYFKNTLESQKKALRTKDKIINTSGAGDNFMAGMIYGYLNGLNTSDKLKYAQIMAYTALLSDKPINDELSIEYINKLLKENEDEFR